MWSVIPASMEGFTHLKDFLHGYLLYNQKLRLDALNLSPCNSVSIFCSSIKKQVHKEKKEDGYFGLDWYFFLQAFGKHYLYLIDQTL